MFDQPDGGEFVFDEHVISGERPDQIAATGIDRTFQNFRLFPSMTVIENVLVARGWAGLCHALGLVAANQWDLIHVP